MKLPRVLFVTGKGGTGKSTVAAALALALSGRRPTTLADLEVAISGEPENWAARYHCGKLFLVQGRFEDALHELTETLALNPKCVAAYLSRALAHADGLPPR